MGIKGAIQTLIAVLPMGDRVPRPCMEAPDRLRRLTVEVRTAAAPAASRRILPGAAPLPCGFRTDGPSRRPMSGETRPASLPRRGERGMRFDHAAVLWDCSRLTGAPLPQARRR